MSVATTSRRRRRPSRQAGMTLLEIMIVLAILALVMGLLLGPRILRAFKESQEDVAKDRVCKMVYEGYLDWMRHNPGKTCPGALSEVTQYMDNTSTKDGNGKELIMYCGDNLPPGASQAGFAVATADQSFKSWEKCSN